MCGRLACALCPNEIINNCPYTNSKDQEEYPEWFQTLHEYTPIYNGAPSSVLPVMVHSKHFSTKNESPATQYCIVPMRWGMLLKNKPESVSSTFHTHNARLENVLNSYLYKPPLKSGQRCVILADGYYEWQTTKGDNFKQPYYIYQSPEEDSKGKHLLKFAGLFNKIEQENEVKYSCSMLTTEADVSFSWMHHRIPVILNTSEEIFNWLNPESKNYEKVVQSLPKYSEWETKFKLKYHPVDKAFINRSNIDSEQCRNKITLKDNKRKSTSTLDSWVKRMKK